MTQRTNTRQNVLTVALMTALACQYLMGCSGVNSAEKSVQVSDSGKLTDLAQVPANSTATKRQEKPVDYFDFWKVARSYGPLGITKVQARLTFAEVNSALVNYYFGPIAVPSAARLTAPNNWNELASEVLYWPCLESGEPWPVVQTHGDVPLLSIAVYPVEDHFGVALHGGWEGYEPMRPLAGEYKPGFEHEPDAEDLCARRAGSLASIITHYHWYYKQMPESPSQAFDALHLKMQQEPWEALLALYPSIMAYKRPDNTAVALHLTGPGIPDLWHDLQIHPKKKLLNYRPAIPYGKSGLSAHIAQQLQEMVLWEDLSAHQWDYVEVPRLESAPERNENR
ncbi:MAG: hypothetical protein GEEBNDBF_02605 [bacterium]|nr:hypothetical protein [bacterium]